MLNLTLIFGLEIYSPTLQSKYLMKRFLIALIVLGTISSCAKPKDLEFVDIQNLSIIEWGLSESLIGLEVRFYNPNNQSVKMKDADAKVYVNSAYLGDARMDSTLSVPQRDTFAVPLILKVSTATTLAKVLETLSDSTVMIKVDGNVKMGKGGMFINYPIKYEKNQDVAELKQNIHF